MPLKALLKYQKLLERVPGYVYAGELLVLEPALKASTSTASKPGQEASNRIHVGLGPFFRVAVPLHTTWTLSRSGVTKSISVDDSHLFVYVPSDYPELVTSVDPRGVQPEMGLAGRGPVRVGGSW